MCSASAAMRTCSAVRSTSEKTATLRIFISRSARVMRTAISPRLAMRTLRNMHGDCSKRWSHLTPHVHILYINIMKALKAADLVWLATAQLQREQKDRLGFSPDEILKSALAIEPDLGFSVNTIRTHISRHCVANLPPAGAIHRMLTRNPNGTYRLYCHGAEYHPGRAGGKTCPDANA